MGISWSSTRRSAPPMVPSDIIVPAHYWDNKFPGRPIVIYDLLRFDGILDPEKLKTSLETLLELQGWCRLGARLRLNETGNIDYHIPTYFDEKRVPFFFDHEALGISINEHPRASRFRADPDAIAPRIQCREADWVNFMWQPGDPKTLEDYLYSDRPILAIRVVTFTDATLLTISWPHMIFDAMGNAEFLRAWTLILNGREDEVPQFLGSESDPLATLGTKPVQKFKHANKQIGIRQMIVLGLRYICCRLWDPEPEDGRTIFVPAAYARHLCETARSDLKATQIGDKVPFISEGDVICAWWAKQIARAQLPKPSNQEVALYNVFGLRGRLGQDLLPPNRAYVGNAFCSVPAFMTARDILIKSLSFVAAAIRKSYMDLGTRDQVEALMNLNRFAQGGLAVFGSPWMHMIVCSNWTKADLFNIDFSGALTQHQHGGQRTVGKPSFIQGHGFFNGFRFSMIGCFIVTGKDAEGNIWLHSYLNEKCWTAVNRMLEDAVKR